MADAGYRFEAHTLDVPEDYDPDMPKEHIGQYLAVRKNRAYREHFPGHLIITADTTVVWQDELLEKAASHAEAKVMLQKLSGSHHQVITGVCVWYNGKEIAFDEMTDVEFHNLSETEIDHYIKK